MQHEDGTVDNYNSHLFKFTSKQDKIIMHIPLKKEWKKDANSCSQFLFNSVIKAYHKDRLIAYYGDNLKRHMIGNQKVCIPVPMDAYGSEIRVEIFLKLDFMENNLTLWFLWRKKNSYFSRS